MTKDFTTENLRIIRSPEYLDFLQMLNNPADGDILSITVGIPYTDFEGNPDILVIYYYNYTFVETINIENQGEVLIGDSVEDTISNLRDAINYVEENDGITFTYIIGTEPNYYFTSRIKDSNTLILTRNDLPEYIVAILDKTEDVSNSFWLKLGLPITSYGSVFSRKNTNIGSRLPISSFRSNLFFDNSFVQVIASGNDLPFSDTFFIVASQTTMNIEASGYKLNYGTDRFINLYIDKRNRRVIYTRRPGMRANR